MIPKRHFVPVQVVRERVHSGFSFRMKFSFWYEASFILVSLKTGNPVVRDRGGSGIFFRRGCTRLLRYFNTNKPHSFFLQNTSCIRKPQVISRRGGAHPLHPPPRSAPARRVMHANLIWRKKHPSGARTPQPELFDK